MNPMTTQPTPITITHSIIDINAIRPKTANAICAKADKFDPSNPYLMTIVRSAKIMQARGKGHYHYSTSYDSGNTWWYSEGHADSECVESSEVLALEHYSEDWLREHLEQYEFVGDMSKADIVKRLGERWGDWRPSTYPAS